MSKAPVHKWEFAARFRKGAFGWRSQPAILRIKEAVGEISGVAKKDPLLGAEGAVRFIEKLVPAIEQVDSSSGGMGTAVNRALDALLPIIAKGPADAETREKWLGRVWEAFQDDGYSYLEGIGDHWGELCASPEVASRWADRLAPTLRMCWTDPSPGFHYFHGTSAALSALLTAGRYQEVLDLLALKPTAIWSDKIYGVKALVALDRKAEALRYARASQGINDSPYAIARECEEILLSSGMREEAYRQYAVLANRKSTNIATFKAIAKTYPEREPTELLKDLVASMPGEEGKWFAAAKDAGQLELAQDLARRSGADPKTLNRAARDFAEQEPRFALTVALASLEWMARGFGYDIMSSDVTMAYDEGLKAARILGVEEQMKQAVRELIGQAGLGGEHVRANLEYRLKAMPLK